MKAEARCLRGSHPVGCYLGLLLVLFAIGGSEAGSAWSKSLPEARAGVSAQPPRNDLLDGAQDLLHGGVSAWQVEEEGTIVEF